MFTLGIDVGSSSVKVSLFDVESGKTLASSTNPSSEAPILAIRPGWAEQDPDSWWGYMKDGIKDISLQGYDLHSVKAIGIAYQMHGLVCVGKDGKPLRNSIIWCDSRAVPYGNQAFEALGEEYCLSHLMNSPGNFTAAKLAWVKENEKGIYDRIWKIMLPGDYIALRLTGEASTTVSGLSEGIFWDFKENAPSARIKDFFGFDEEIFPDIHPCFSVQGQVLGSVAAELGLSAGTPVTYRAGDQPNNALSLGVMNPGQIAATAGTSGVVYGVGDNIQTDPSSRVNVFAHVNHTAEQNRYGVLLCINGTGILNSWIHRNTASALSYSQMNELAAQVPQGSAGLRILPFGNGSERILSNRDCACSIHGLNFNIHDQRHLFRAAQEGIVFSFQYGMEIMKNMGMKIDTIHAGLANMFLSPIFRESLSNLSGAEIRLMKTDGSAGAARGAAIGAKIYNNAEEAFESLETLDVITPKPSDALSEAYEEWKQLLNTKLL